MKKFDSVVTDMDQVICASQTIHGNLESEVLAGFGHTVSPEVIAARFTGMGTEYVFEHYLGAGLVHAALEQKERGLQMLTSRDIQEIKGATRFYRKLSSIVCTGLASGSSIEFIDLVIRSLDLTSIFEAIASGEEVAKGKPEPDVFLLALERLGRDPRQCVIIEDGLSGIIAAKKIGAIAVGITTSYDSKSLKESGADYVVDSFLEMEELFKL